MEAGTVLDAGTTVTTLQFGQECNRNKQGDHHGRSSQLPRHHHRGELREVPQLGGQGRDRFESAGRDAGAGEDPGQQDQRLPRLHRRAHQGRPARWEGWIGINLVAVWREAIVFTDAERAALELTEQGTRIADAAGGVTDEAWANAAKHYDDDQLAALVSLIALINTYNRVNVIIQQPAGDYQPGQWG